ncbi:class I SAM-dependent methyltransferase [Leptothermofonsia sp. ETS-13]|uniref:class I SAM-dependent methyltransferase n=1 Tax=Leptothermofonsia sp. ETS-13 TaxID=3035696 RepID=UPI003B9F5A1B
MKCKICQADSSKFGCARVLGRYSVDYFQCSECGLVQTEEPYWLEEAYLEAIAPSDVGLVFRNQLSSAIASNVIFNLFDHEKNLLDYGGGCGLFVRLMRDLGYDFYWHDKYCKNLFAKGFEADSISHPSYELVTAFEVFEHLVNPIDEIGSILKSSQNILFSTTLLPPESPKLEDWSYYALHEGQHIVIYTMQALRVIANRFQLRLYSNGFTVHLLTVKEIDPAVFDQLVSVQRLDQRKASLLESDYYKIVDALLQRQEQISSSNRGCNGSQPILLVAFPDWAQPEAILLPILENTFKAVLQRAGNARIALSFYAGRLSPVVLEEAELLLSSAVMQSLMQDEIEVPDGLEVSLISELDSRWSERSWCRLSLDCEDEAAIAIASQPGIPVISWEALAAGEHCW